MGHSHLVPVVDQRLDTWPPASRSPTKVRSAAQQIAQWQQQQQQQLQQQQQQMGGVGDAPAQWQQQVCCRQLGCVVIGVQPTAGLLVSCDGMLMMSWHSKSGKMHVSGVAT